MYKTHRKTNIHLHLLRSEIGEASLRNVIKINNEI